MSLYSNDTQPVEAYRLASNGSIIADYCVTPNLSSPKLSKRYWWFWVAVVAYRTVDAALNFYNIQDECRHFNEAVMNGVNCIWDVGTTIAAWGGGAKKINNAINEITARYDKKRLFAELPHGGWKRDISPALDDLADLLDTQGIGLLGIDYINHSEMTEAQSNRLLNVTVPNNQLIKRDGSLTTLVVTALLNSTVLHYGFHQFSQYGFTASIEPTRELEKRSEFYDEYFNGNDGIDISLCTNGEDPGVTNAYTDFGEYFDDLHCHGNDMWNSQGIYWQTYDKNNRGTIDSGAMSPYFDGHASDIRQMTWCPSGLRNTCGDL